MKLSTENVHAKSEIDELTRHFFSLFTNANGTTHTLDLIYQLFIPEGIIIKNTGSDPETYNLQQFIEPRKKLLTDGTLQDFREEEVSEKTEIFGTIAQRFSAYRKSGILSGVYFETKGMKTMQFVKTREGWKISAVAWDDEK